MKALEKQTGPLKTPCRHLRCKEMYYQAPTEGGFASGVHWCSKTQENYGPDGDPVDKTACCTGRKCYVG
jgi:hypothetical protein